MIPGNGPLPSSSHPALSTWVANNHTLAGPANENKYLPMSADSFPLQRKKKKRAAGLGHRNPRHTEQSWWSLSPWLVWPFCLGSLWKAPPLHLGEEQGWAGTVVHLFFPLRKNSLRQASSSDTWLIFDPHASLFFPLRCGGISKWVGRGRRIGDADLSVILLHNSPWGWMRSHIRAFIPEGANSHHIQKTIGDGVEGGRGRNSVDTVLKVLSSCLVALLSSFYVLYMQSHYLVSQVIKKLVTKAHILEIVLWRSFLYFWPWFIVGRQLGASTRSTGGESQEKPGFQYGPVLTNPWYAQGWESNLIFLICNAGEPSASEVVVKKVWDDRHHQRNHLGQYLMKNTWQKC